MTGRVVVLNGRRVDPAEACVPIDDPALRGGEGILETMRGQDGRVPLLDRHVARLEASVRDLGLHGVPGGDAIRRDVAAAVSACGPGALRVRVTVTPQPTLIVDVTPWPGDGAARADGIAAATVRGAWLPENRMAEHKTTARMLFAQAGRIAAAAGAGAALLLDSAGNLGEADRANVFVVAGGEAVTAPVRGLLPGVIRDAVLAAAPAREGMIAEDLWRAADEIFLTNGVQGVTPVVRVDGAPVGDGRPGPVTRRMIAAVDALFGVGAPPADP